MIKHRPWQLLRLLIVTCLSTQLHAKVASMEFDDVVKASDTIVLGQVVDVSTMKGVKIARVKVIDTYKGVKFDELFFLAQPTWICDISEAETGETALLFLSPYIDKWDGSDETLLKRLPTRDALRKAGAGQALFLITDSGRGRMPIRTVGNEKFATFWTGDIRLPVTVRTIPGPEKRYKFIRSAALTDLLALIDIQITLGRLFPNAPAKTPNADCFRSLTHGSSVYVAVKRCGRPDNELGSGVYIFVYHLNDGSTVAVNTPSLERIDRITLTDPSGKQTSLLPAP